MRTTNEVNKGMTGLGSSVGRVSAPRSGGTRFDPGPRHTKVINNSTSCSPLGTQIFGVGLGLVAPVSLRCQYNMTGGGIRYQVKVSGV